MNGLELAHKHISGRLTLKYENKKLTNSGMIA